jgi:hypothetical protein
MHEGMFPYVNPTNVPNVPHHLVVSVNIALQSQRHTDCPGIGAFFLLCCIPQDHVYASRDAR